MEGLCVDGEYDEETDDFPVNNIIEQYADIKQT